ncbi:MAG: cation:proton antiporter subunit C [Spirochaetaceae bacterium]|nr:cation:proton antiporter subunit C [Spirochaetaceae bacterium]
MMVQIIVAVGVLLILVGLWGLLSRRNLIKMILGFSIMDTGTHLIIVGLGYRTGATAPILDSAVPQGTPVVDPVPSALVLTAIVIGLAVTALMLAYAVRLHGSRGTAAIEDFKENAL